VRPDFIPLKDARLKRLCAIEAEARAQKWARGPGLLSYERNAELVSSLMAPLKSAMARSRSLCLSQLN
jgi:hypothetical protein